MNIDTFAIQKIADIPEAPEGTQAITKIAWNPTLRAVIISSNKLWAYEVDSGKLTSWARTDGFLGQDGHYCRPSTIFYDPQTTDMVTIGGIDFSDPGPGVFSKVYWRHKMQ
jgi:hypothetical protein